MAIRLDAPQNAAKLFILISARHIRSAGVSRSFGPACLTRKRWVVSVWGVGQQDCRTMSPRRLMPARGGTHAAMWRS